MAARLSFDEREEIALDLAAGVSIRSIARRLGRAPSTISRDVGKYSFHRHAVEFNHPGMRYKAGSVHSACLGQRPRRRASKLVTNVRLRKVVLRGLRKRWSPRQIAGRLREDYPDQPEMWVSHETIYQSIYLQSRGNLREELKHQVALRSGRARRRPRAAVAGAVRSNRSWLGLNVSERPAEADDRAVPGHWEGDLVIGKDGKSAVATLVERSTRYVMLVGLDGAWVSEHVVDRLTQTMSRLPVELLKSLTWDQGTEMAQHIKFTLATDCTVYFCDPHSPWQRGTNENTNGLLRQYYPKGVTNFRTVTQAQLDEVARELNERPRQTLHWKTPAEKIAELLTSVATNS
jgi:transposase, IS30 family